VVKRKKLNEKSGGLIEKRAFNRNKRVTKLFL
jgi:hypothetical protein